jgi:hypothetical protein
MLSWREHGQLNLHTYLISLMEVVGGEITPLYSGGYCFLSLPSYRLSWVTYLVFILSPSERPTTHYID